MRLRLLLPGILALSLFLRTSEPVRANPVVLAAPVVAVGSLEALSLTVAAAASIGIITEAQDRDFQQRIASHIEWVKDETSEAWNALLQKYEELQVALSQAQDHSCTVSVGHGKGDGSDPCQNHSAEELMNKLSCGQKISCPDIRTLLKELGFSLSRQKGSHEQWANGPNRITVACHKKDADPALLREMKKGFGCECDRRH